MTIEEPFDVWETNDGRQVHVYEEPSGFKVTDSQGRKIGGIEYYWLDTGNGDVPLATSIDVDGPDRTNAFKRQGIGEKLVRLLNQQCGSMIAVRFPNGEKYEDGSELVGDGPRFWARMIEKGLAAYLDYERPETSLEERQE